MLNMARHMKHAYFPAFKHLVKSKICGKGFEKVDSPAEAFKPASMFSDIKYRLTIFSFKPVITASFKKPFDCLKNNYNLPTVDNGP